MLSIVCNAWNGRQPLGEDECNRRGGGIVIGAHWNWPFTHTCESKARARAHSHRYVADGNKLNVFARIGFGCFRFFIFFYFCFFFAFSFWPHQKYSPLDFVILRSIFSRLKTVIGLWLQFGHTDKNTREKKNVKIDRLRVASVWK